MQSVTLKRATLFTTKARLPSCGFSVVSQFAMFISIVRAVVLLPGSPVVDLSSYIQINKWRGECVYQRFITFSHIRDEVANYFCLVNTDSFNAYRLNILLCFSPRSALRCRTTSQLCCSEIPVYSSSGTVCSSSLQAYGYLTAHFTKAIEVVFITLLPGSISLGNEQIIRFCRGIRNSEQICHVTWKYFLF